MSVKLKRKKKIFSGKLLVEEKHFSSLYVDSAHEVHLLIISGALSFSESLATLYLGGGKIVFKILLEIVNT